MSPKNSHFKCYLTEDEILTLVLQVKNSVDPDQMVSTMFLQCFPKRIKPCSA